MAFSFSFSFKDCVYKKDMHRIYLDKKMVSLDTPNTGPPEYITIAGNLRSVVFKYGGYCYLPHADSFFYRVYDLEEKEKLRLHKIELQLFIR